MPGQAPGPPGHFLLGNLLALRRDVLGALLTGRRQYGDVVRFRLGPLVAHLVSHPEPIRQVLITRHENYTKQTRSSARIRSITGEGLLTADGPLWLRQRRLMQPAFAPSRLAGFVRVAAETTAAMLDRWQPGGLLDVASEMMRLTYAIIGRVLFGSDVSGDAPVVEQAAAVVMARTYRRLERVVTLPEWFPLPANVRFRRALRRLDQVVYRIIQERGRLTTPPADLLTILLRCRDDEEGKGMSDEQLRNEVLTLLLAGHETTANALTWTWYLLSRAPGVRRRLAAEAADVLGGRLPAFADLQRLRYTTMVFQEAMRLYPPIWIMERRVVAADVLGGHLLPAGSTVWISPFVTHRHPDFWDNPEGFDPDRFDSARAEPPPQAYIPFGAGQRLCIGQPLAMLEAQVILAMTAQRFRLDLVPGARAEPLPGITLRVRDGLPMTVHPAQAPQVGHSR
jgi:cytochrome P450